MSRFKDYLEKTAPVIAEQCQKFWRSEYLYLNVLNQKGTDLGRLGIELNSRIASSTSRNLRSVWFNQPPSAINLHKTIYQGYPALKMTFNTQTPSLGNFVDTELNSNYISETEELTPQSGDIIRPDSSDSLYIICSTPTTENSEKATENNPENPETTPENPRSEQPEKQLFDYIKVGTISNVNGFGILQEVNSLENGNSIKANEIGSYKKLYTIKFMKLYVIVSLLSFYVVHFTGYKGEATVHNQELHDLLMKHH